MGWPGECVGAEGSFAEGDQERRAAIFIGPKLGTVPRPDLVSGVGDAVAAGSYPHMLAQQMTTRMGAQVEPVPYKGDAPMWLDVVSGQTTAGQGSVPHIQSGRLRAIAVSSRVRTPLLPDVPTFEEQGFADPIFTIVGWLGMFAPSGTPMDIIQRVSDLVQEGANTPRIKQLGRNFGMTTKPCTAQEFERFDREVGPQWVAAAKELNISPE